MHKRGLQQDLYLDLLSQSLRMYLVVRLLKYTQTKKFIILVYLHLCVINYSSISTSIDGDIDGNMVDKPALQPTIAGSCL